MSHRRESSRVIQMGRFGFPSGLRAAAMILLAGWLTAGALATKLLGQTPLVSIVQSVQPMMVKIYGAGGLRGLESYQSGFVISADGYVLTAWSYVLDTDDVIVTLHDGRKFTGTLTAADPQLEIALLKIDARDLAYFNLDSAVTLQVAERVLAFSNLYGVATGNEPTSVLHGCVTAVSPLNARRGTHPFPYRGSVYVLDAMTNNAGAAGGALTDRQGRLAGLLGKELRDAASNAWLNYALPIDALRSSVEKMKSGESIARIDPDDLQMVDDPWTLEMLGLRLVPDLLTRTPPYIDRIVADSAAESQGLRPDDLVLYVNQHLVRSVKEVRRELSTLSREQSITVVCQRDAELVTVIFNPQ
ncbi:MAG: trypsin-like peptidase domain-containing protein [Planctomycetales bacterium]|nr:trypsin-like peptidase domain-containing protein [Planctomycetales bacterium]